MTITLVFCLMFYGLMQAMKLVTYDDTDVMLSQRDSYFDSDFILSDGLWFAFGLTAFDNNQEWVEDPSIGVLKPYYK